MYFVGLDVHFKRSTLCILDENGKRVKHLEVKGPWQRLLEVLEVVDAQAPKPFAICYEASCEYGHLHDQFAKRAERVTVAHPGPLRLIFRSKKKHDRDRTPSSAHEADEELDDLNGGRPRTY